MPEGTPDLSHDALAAYLDSRDERKIGATVTVENYREGVIDVRLYDTRIAQIGPNLVFFPGPDDPHIATTYWLAKVVQDNGIGGNVFRVRRHKSDGEGPPVARGQAGLLTVDGDRDRPVFGRSYPVDHARIARRRQVATS
jgi:hypothetical protein